MPRKPRVKEEYVLWGSLKLAQDRIGQDPGECLAWIIRFAQMDLSTLRPEERTAFAKDLAFFPIVVQHHLSPSARMTGDATPIPDATFPAIHAELGQFFHDLMEGITWTVPGQKKLLISRESPEGSAQTQFRMVWETRGNTRDAIFATVARLLMEHGQKVRACPECRKVFIATRRQEYCDARCSQRVRNLRRKGAIQ